MYQKNTFIDLERRRKKFDPEKIFFFTNKNAEKNFPLFFEKKVELGPVKSHQRAGRGFSNSCLK